MFERDWYSISEQIGILGAMSKEIAISAKEGDELSQSNKRTMDMATASMENERPLYRLKRLI